MARARVELRGSLTHEASAAGGGRKMKKGSPVVLTNPAHIQYYRDQAGFAVTFLADKKKAKPVATEPDGGDGEPGGGGAVLHTEAELKKMRKSELVVVADALGMEEPDEHTVAELVSGILDAQVEG